MGEIASKLYHDISRIFAITIFMMIYGKITQKLQMIAAGRQQRLLVQTQRRALSILFQRATVIYDRLTNLKFHKVAEAALECNSSDQCWVSYFKKNISYSYLLVLTNSN